MPPSSIHKQPTNDALNDQPGVVFGVGIFGETSQKDQEWLPEEQRANKEFSHVIGFDRLFITSDIDVLDFASGNREKYSQYAQRRAHCTYTKRDFDRPRSRTLSRV